MFRISVLLRILGRTALFLYLLVAALFLVVRYAILPNLDHWRPEIQAQLSRVLNTDVTLGRIEASWKGLHPRLQLNDVAFFDEYGNQVLGLPIIRATLGWQGLLQGMPRFSYIEAIGLHIEARRDRQQRIWILGQNIQIDDDEGASEIALNDPALQWLAQQPSVALRNAAITWRDETRDARPLKLDAVTLGLESRPGLHRLFLSATPPQALGRQFEMRARFDKTDSRLEQTDPLAWEGVFYTHIEGMSPVQWRPWIDVPGHMLSGDVSAKWWLTFARAEPVRVAAQAEVSNGHWLLGESGRVQADEVQVLLDGPAAAYEGVLQALEHMLAPIGPGEAESNVPPIAESAEPDISSHPEAEVLFQSDYQGLVVEMPSVFDHALNFEHIQMRGGLHTTPDAKLMVRFDDTHVLNQDMDLRLRGSWRQGGSGSAGLADFTGVFRYASLDGIGLYLPESVNLDAREWLIRALLDGQLENASAVLRGDLERFPFGDGSGQFRIEGSFRNGVIDYAPERNGKVGWPALRQVNGRASLNRVDLRLVADEAVVNPVPDQTIVLRNVIARIPNIERDSVLSIEGQTQAAAASYLALARHSPVQRLLDGFLDPAQADGNWEVPLRLTIPLLNVDDTRVRGEVRFQGGMVSLEPAAPPFEQVNGTLEFSETGFGVSGLEARFLGGAAELNGGIGGKREGLDMQGTIQAGALEQYVGTQGLQRLTGALAYQAQLRRRSSGRYALTAQSDLQGLGIDLPAPAGKAADSAKTLKVGWVPAPEASDMYLDVALGSDMQARFVRRSSERTGSYFRAGVIGTTLPKQLSSTGLLVDVRYPHIDVSEWNAVIDEFSEPIEGSQEAGRQLFPTLQRMRLQADTMWLYGLKLDTAALTAHREQPLKWRMDVVSAQTAGTLFWYQAAESEKGRVEAKFDRLALGSASGSETGESDTNEAQQSNSTDEQQGFQADDIDIPAIDLEVDKLTLYGRSVGRLAVEGLNEQGGRFWRLNKLRLVSPAAELKGEGIWRRTGAERGLTLDADVRFSDAGAFLNQLEFKNILEGGQGQLKGRLEWRNMPWRFDRTDLNGQFRLELEQGRFSTVNSRSARLLELLSLQSLQRIATFSFNPASVFKEGFPFDRLAGTLHIRDGVLTTNDYGVSSPVAAISIGGDVDLKTEKIDLQAMVVPKVDVSGASVAAGLAINPIVGLGAFVTQWLLSKPLSKAMTVHYDVTGDLSSPELAEVAASQPHSAEPLAGQIDGSEIRLYEPLEGGLRPVQSLEGLDSLQPSLNLKPQ